MSKKFHSISEREYKITNKKDKVIVQFHANVTQGCIRVRWEMKIDLNYLEWTTFSVLI